MSRTGHPESVLAGPGRHSGPGLHGNGVGGGVKGWGCSLLRGQSVSSIVWWFGGVVVVVGVGDVR